MPNTLFYAVYAGLCLCACVYSACTPESVRDDLDKCLRNNKMLSYYMFPKVSTDNYRNLCFNTTCLTYCMELVVEPCMSHDHTVHLGNGDALKAAYIGLCDLIEDNVMEALDCSNAVSETDVLNTTRFFQTSLQNSYTASSVNANVICSEWMTMIGTLNTLISGACSGTSLTYWQTFLNTVSHKCDASLSPSWYTLYSQTVNDRCSGSDALLPCIQLYLLLYFALLLTFV